MNKIKGLISNMWLFVLLHNTTHRYKTLYQIEIPKSSSCCETFDRTKFIGANEK